MGQPLQVWSVMPAHFQHAKLFALPANAIFQVLATGGYSFRDSGSGQVLTRCKKVLDLLKYPGVTNTGPANHDTINAISMPVFQCFFRRVDIAIAKYRNMHPGVFFNPGYPTPVCNAFVHLFSGPGMNGEGLYANILEPFGYFDNIDAVLIPTQSGLDRYRFARALYNCRR